MWLKKDRKKTDRERLTDLLNEFGVGWDYINSYFPDQCDPSSKATVYCCQGDANIDGYSGFFACFDFDENGKFKGMGVYE